MPPFANGMDSEIKVIHVGYAARESSMAICYMKVWHGDGNFFQDTTIMIIYGKAREFVV